MSLPSELLDLREQYDNGLIPMQEVFKADHSANSFKAGVVSTFSAVMDVG